jgi:hypothetical protein
MLSPLLAALLSMVNPRQTEPSPILRSTTDHCTAGLFKPPKPTVLVSQDAVRLNHRHDDRSQQGITEAQRGLDALGDHLGLSLPFR